MSLSFLLSFLLSFCCFVLSRSCPVVVALSLACIVLSMSRFVPLCLSYSSGSNHLLNSLRPFDWLHSITLSPFAFVILSFPSFPSLASPLIISLAFSVLQRILFNSPHCIAALLTGFFSLDFLILFSLCEFSFPSSIHPPFLFPPVFFPLSLSSSPLFPYLRQNHT